MDWRHRAACRDVDPELFFPIGNTGPALMQIEEAKQVCRTVYGRRAVPEVGARVGPGRRRLGRPERGRTPRRQAPHRPGPRPRQRLNSYNRIRARPHCANVARASNPVNVVGGNVHRNAEHDFRAAAFSRGDVEAPGEFSHNEGPHDLQTEIAVRSRGRIRAAGPDPRRRPPVPACPDGVRPGPPRFPAGLRARVPRRSGAAR